MISGFSIPTLPSTYLRRHNHLHLSRGTYHTSVAHSSIVHSSSSPTISHTNFTIFHLRRSKVPFSVFSSVYATIESWHHTVHVTIEHTCGVTLMGLLLRSQSCDDDYCFLSMYDYILPSREEPMYHLRSAARGAALDKLVARAERHYWMSGSVREKTGKRRLKSSE